MAKNFKVFFHNGVRNKYVGGVLPSVLALLLIFSLIFSQQLKSYRNEAILYQQTKQMYQGKTLENMTLAKLQKRYGSGEELVLGEDCYNIGVVTYKVTGDQVDLEIALNTGLRYQEKVSLGDD